MASSSIYNSLTPTFSSNSNPNPSRRSFTFPSPQLPKQFFARTLSSSSLTTNKGRLNFRTRRTPFRTSVKCSVSEVTETVTGNSTFFASNFSFLSFSIWIWLLWFKFWLQFYLFFLIKLIAVFSWCQFNCQNIYFYR